MLACKKAFIFILISVFFVNSWAWGLNEQGGNQDSFVFQDKFRREISPNNANDIIFDLFLNNHNIHSLKDYAFWLAKNLHYEPDLDIDEWSSPLQTVDKGYGDCEDLAFLSAAVLKRLGYKPHVIGTKKSSKGHVFCVFQINGKYYIFENTRFIITKATSIHQIAKFLFKKYDIEYLFEIKQNPKAIRILFTREMISKMTS